VKLTRNLLMNYQIAARAFFLNILKITFIYEQVA
jgi:hypothetical protein